MVKADQSNPESKMDLELVVFYFNDATLITITNEAVSQEYDWNDD